MKQRKHLKIMLLNSIFLSFSTILPMLRTKEQLQGLGNAALDGTRSALASLATASAGAFAGACAALDQDSRRICPFCKHPKANKESSGISIGFDENDNEDDFLEMIAEKTNPLLATIIQLKNSTSNDTTDLMQKLQKDLINQYKDQANPANHSSQNIIHEILDTKIDLNYAISKQLAKMYITLQTEILSRALKTASNTEQLARLRQENEMHLAEVLCEQEIERAKDKKNATISKALADYNRSIKKAYPHTAVIAQNNQLLHEIAQELISENSKPEHYANLESYIHLLESLRT